MRPGHGRKRHATRRRRISAASALRVARQDVPGGKLRRGSLPPGRGSEAMEPIRRVAETGPAGTAKGARAASGGAAFDVPSSLSPSAPAPLAASAAPSALSGLIALQEAESDRVGDRAARRRGRDLLDELARLQRDLLAGGATSARLKRLAALLEGLPTPADPGLGEALAAVALRARVELARYGQG
jgi:hypothetical protein